MNLGIHIFRGTKHGSLRIDGVPGPYGHPINACFLYTYHNPVRKMSLEVAVAEVEDFCDARAASGTGSEEARIAPLRQSVFLPSHISLVLAHPLVWYHHAGVDMSEHEVLVQSYYAAGNGH